MNRKKIRSLALAALMLMGSFAAMADNWSVPKREFRSAWIATVWALDWPGSHNASAQQAQMTRMLDSLQANNFNAVNFQVRSMCDAMYQSSYEPWSSYLTGTRGQVPTYDPLAFVIEEAHKRGMEVHAWVNPYRFSTGSDWNTEQDQELKNSGHLLTHGTTTILDPGQQWTIDRIVNVCREIVTNYDVDGILYDDYFYPSGIPTNSTAGDYTEWQESGTTLSFGDWRRDNVNRMVHAVYQMIQEVKPWVRYGISPAGVAATSSTVASKYGVDPCPSGSSDWQYNGIFSDPLAWLSAQDIDYISPQVYWHIGATADFSTITPWWGKVAAKFGRQVFISESISDIKASSTDAEMNEYANQVEITRTSSVDGAPGSIFYSAKYLYAMNYSHSLAQYLKSTTFSRPALPPAMPWKEQADPGQVDALSLDEGEGILDWSPADNVRYAVYAYPSTLSQDLFTKQVDYLLGMSYENSYQLPADKLGSEWSYAVTIVDRVGNEWEPAFLAQDLPQLDKPVLLSPDDGATAIAPFSFEWQPVEGAESYTVQVSASSDFSPIAQSVSTTATSVPVSELTALSHNTTAYWRVVASAPLHFSGVSQVRAITPKLLTITSPADGEEDVQGDVTFEWYNLESDAPMTLQIARTSSFAADSVVFTGTSATGTLTVPDGTLEAGYTYYARVQATIDGMAMTSPTVTFICAYGPSTFVHPAGGILLGTEYVEVKPQEWAGSYGIEISNSATTWARTRYTETLRNGATTSSKLASEMKVNGSTMTEGNTYYIRTKTTYVGTDGANHTTGWSEIVPFVYYATQAPQQPTGDINGDGNVDASDVTALISHILGSGQVSVDLATGDLNADGVIDSSDITLLIGIILGA